MKEAILTTLTLVLCVVGTQCFASESKKELLELLKGLTSDDDKDEPQLEPVPLNLESELVKKHSVPKGCGQLPDERTYGSGTVDFPEGDGNYSPGSNCAWAFFGGSGSRVTVTFTFVEIGNWPCFDHMQVYLIHKKWSPGNYQAQAMTNRICPRRVSDMNHRTFTASNGGILVKFESSRLLASNAKGFILNYQIQRTGEVATPSPTQSPSLFSCGTNKYGSRRKRDLRSLLKSLIELEDKKEENELEEGKEQLEDRIIGGQMSQKGQFPWIVHIRTFPQGIEAGKYFKCGGSIINENWIISAAHCFEDEETGQLYNDPNNVRIYPGRNYIDNNLQIEESQSVLVPEKIIFHHARDATASNRDPKWNQYDVVLIKLKYKLTYTDTVNAVCLPDRSFQPGTNCIAAGWGITESGGTSNDLLHASLKILNDRDCRPFSIWEDMICAKGNAATCKGDSGGPLMCKRGKGYELAGVVSFNVKTCPYNWPEVYADIYYLMPWIQSTINSG